MSALATQGKGATQTQERGSNVLLLVVVERRPGNSMASLMGKPGEMDSLAIGCKGSHVCMKGSRHDRSENAAERTNDSQTVLCDEHGMSRTAISPKLAPVSRL